jgi:hypothetical protein
MSDKLVTVAQFEDSIAANLAKQKLADFGIECFLEGENFSNMYSGLSIAAIKLQTLQSQAKQALEILESQSEGDIE